MKKVNFILIATLLICTFKANSQTGWFNSTSPIVADTLLGEIQYITANEAWICNGKGGAIHTSDGGISWTKVQPFPNDSLFVSSDAAMGMSWPNVNNGYILATIGGGMFNSSGVVFISTHDGGLSWSKQKIDSTNLSALQVQFVDANNGWVSMFSFTSGLTVLKTSDAGTTWTELPDHYITPFRFVNTLDGWGVATWDDNSDTLGTHWSIVKTTDGGLNWQFVYTDTARDVYELLFIRAFSATSCIVEGPNKKFLKTTDGGVTWSAIAYPVYYDSLSRHKNFDFINMNEGWLTEDPENNSLECIVHHTTDGGLNWETQHPILSNGSLFAINFFDADHGLLVGETCTNCNDSTGTFSPQIRRFIGNSTGVNDEVLGKNIVVYPNPSTGIFSIASDQRINYIECQNIVGQIILSTPTDSNTLSIDLSNQKKGVYLLKISSAYKYETFRLIVD